jgi:hypothetical protein
MRIRKLLATAALAVWTVCVYLLTGPIRWELAHTYHHLIEHTDYQLPAPTRTIALPVLELGPDGVGVWLVRWVFLGLAWLGPPLLLVAVWRASSEHEVTERLVYGGALYVAVFALLTILFALGLWLPFAYL